MKLRSIIVTVLVLAGLSLVVFFLRRPPAPAAPDTRVGQPLVDRSVVEKAEHIRITDAGKTVDLVRQPDASWRVASYYDLPADFSKLSTFVSNLTDAKIDRLVTRTPDRIARLEFKDTKIELLDHDNKVVWTVTLGKNADAGGRYLQFGSEPKAYLANLQAWLDTESKNWADSSLVNLKPEDVAKVELPFANGETVTLSRAKKDDPWTATPLPAGQVVNSDRVTSLITSLAHVRFTNTAELTAPEFLASKTNERKAKVTTFDGKTFALTLGRKPEEKKLKPPTPAADGKSGPGALGTVADLSKNGPTPEPASAPAATPKPATPEYDTIPAGPVFVSVEASDANAPVNAFMKKRAFEVSDFVMTGLPAAPADLFKAAPAAPAPAATAEPAKK